MKKVFFFATVVAMSLAVAMPVNAQSRKDKKAAEKAQWEMEQQQKREEAELKHQMRMDSLRNEQRKNEEIEAEAKAARLRAEEERRAAEAKAEQQAKRTRKTVTLPCKGKDYRSDDLKLRSYASREGLDTDAAQQAAFISARRELAALIEVSIQSLSSDYLKGQEKVKTKDQERKLESLTMQSIEHTINMATPICEEYESYFDNDDNEVFVCYVVMEIDRESALKSLHKDLSKQAGDAIQSDYERFKQEFDNHFSKEEERSQAASDGE